MMPPQEFFKPRRGDIECSGKRPETEPTSWSLVMKRVICLLAYALSPSAVPAAEWTLDQQLIIACYEVQPERVAGCLRRGANVNAKFGDYPDDVEPFRDRWIGASYIGADTWSPILALTSAPA